MTDSFYWRSFKHGECRGNQFKCHSCGAITVVTEDLYAKSIPDQECEKCGKILLEVLQFRHSVFGESAGPLRTNKETYRKLLETDSE